MATSTWLCLMILTAAAVGAGAAATSDEVESRSSKPEIHEREDLSVEETGSDYAKQFGTVPGFPPFGHPQRYPNYYSSSWIPYRPVDYLDYSQSSSAIDPYVLRVLQRYLRHVPGPYGGFHGGTKIKPPGVFRFVDKDK